MTESIDDVLRARGASNSNPHFVDYYAQCVKLATLCNRIITEGQPADPGVWRAKLDEIVK